MKITKKVLSVLLAMIMIMTSMSVCFGTLAAGGTATDAQWNALLNALKADSIKSPSFRTVDGKYILDDPDGTVLDAVEAYWSVFDTLANKAPATGNPNNTTNSTGSSEGNRTINQVNTSIKNYIAGMNGYEAYMGTFVGNLIGTANVTAGTGSTQTKGGANDDSNDKTVPGTNLGKIGDISLTVVSGSAVTGYTLEDLPDDVVTEKIFTVSHANDRYDYTYTEGSYTTGSGCNKVEHTSYTRTYKYFYYISGTSVTDGAATSTKVIKDTAATLEANADYFSYTLDQFVVEGFENVSAITAVKDAVVAAKKAVVDEFGGSVFSHFFSAYNVEALAATVEEAEDIIAAAHIAIDLNGLVEAGYADIITDKGALEALANNVKTLADKYDSYSADVKAYVESHEYEGKTFSRAAVTAFYNAILKEIELIELRALKATIEDEGAEYLTYNEDNVTDGTVDEETGKITGSTVTATDLDLARGKVIGWIDAIGTYNSDNVAIVWEGIDVVAHLESLNAELSRLYTLSGYHNSFAGKYAEYVTDVYKKTNLDDDSEDLAAAIKGYDAWYTGLKNLVAEIESAYNEELSAKVIDGLDEGMKAHLDSRYNALHARVFAQIDLADQLYKVLAADGKLSILNIDTYAEFEDALGQVDVDLYNFLLNSANFDMPQLTIDEFNEIWTLALKDYHDFVTSGGFNKYEETAKETAIPDIVRPETEADYHDAHIGDYTVTDEKVEKIISIIEKLLADEEIKALLGNLINKDKETGEPTGEPFDLATLLSGLLNDFVYSDSLINTIVSFVYPAVANEFIKVWATLPESIVMEDEEVLEGKTADVNAALYIGTVEDATAGLDMPLFPKVLADKLRADYGTKYAAAAAVLEQFTTPAFCDTMVNEKGETVADPSTIVSPWTEADLKDISWGIDNATNKKEAFIDAAEAALCGLEPLLLALLCNIPMSQYNEKVGIGEGILGDLTVAEDIFLIGDITINNATLNIKAINLILTATANDGYNNVIGPLLELLGVESPDGTTLTSTRAVITKGLLEPIEAVINKIAANPVKTILEILPNLAYAVEMNMILTKLALLEIDLNYSAGAVIDIDLTTDPNLGIILKYAGSLIGRLFGIEITDGKILGFELADVYASEEPINVKLSDVIKVEDMLNGADISNFNGLWDMITGMLGEGVNLPAPNAGVLATLGKLTWKDTVRSKWSYTPLEAGKAAYIEANKADVLIFLLQYVLGALNANPDLLASFGLELSDDVKAIIASVAADPNATIAAIVELLNGVEYDTLKEYVWYASELNEDTVVGMTPAIQQYLGYDNNWTKETATYLVENVNEIIGAVMAMVGGEEAEPFDLAATLEDLIGGLFTNKNITAIAKLLSKLDLNALLAGDEEVEALAEGEEAALDINALVKKFADIDLSGFAAYAELADDTTWGFEDGDKNGFVAALANLLAPLNPVIDFIFAGADLTLLDGDVKLVGYNGYDSAIVPLLEALGAKNLDAFEGQGGLEAVLGAVLATVETVLADPIDGILNLIPGLLYFVKSNGLTTAVRNLLQPVYVILETIDPIYALNLNELIGGLTTDLGFTIDLGNLTFEAIFDILGAVVALDLSELEEIIDDVCEVITPVDYTSASSVIGENGKKGAYGEFFDAADLVTVLVSFALTWVQEGTNAEDLVALIAGDDAEKAAEIAKYISGAVAIIGGIDPTYETINWAYNFPEGFDEAIFESGLTIQPTINTIKYPTNWTEDAAKYIADNLDEIADEIIGLVDENYASLADFIKANLTIYSAENVNAIVELVAGLLEDIDAVLLDTVGLVLGADLATLKAYKADEGIDTAEEFAAALADILATIQPVVDWLFFGEDYAFFSKAGADLVTIKGAEGYAYGLAPILEALGVAAPAKDEATVANVLEAVFARVDAVLADPVNEVFELLPNVIYFLNANGVSTSVKNLLAGVTGLIGALQEKFGLEVDLMSVFNNLIGGLLPEDSTVTLDVENLDLESIFALVQELIGLDLTPIANILVDLCVGQIVAYKSVSGEYGFKMMYTDDFARYDMITIIISGFLQILKLDANKEALLEMVGEDVYTAILNVISMDVNVPVQEFDWALTEKADTEEVFSAIQSSDMFENHQYGPLYSPEMAQHIADNFGEFVDNVIYLLGIEIEGETVDNLTDLLNGLVGGSVYNSDIIVTIKDALVGLIANIDTLPAGAHIKEVIKLAGLADLGAIAEVEVPEFRDDRDAFTAALCDVLEPIYPVLKWLLSDEDFTFFIDEEEETLVTLLGAEGYAYGIIPLLEVLGCEGILAPDAYYSALEADGDVIITSILNPLLDRVDTIMADPGNEIIDMLPNLIYFINSNGVDTVVKNTLNAVYTLLNAIEPIAKIDLYELIGLDLATIDFEWLFAKALELIAESTGYEFEALDINEILELTVGQLESYTSANGKAAYKMVYMPTSADEGDKTEMVLVVERLVLTFIMHENNQEALLGLLRDNFGMSAEAEKYVGALLKVIADCALETRLGMDTALATIYYVFYGVETGAGAAAGGLKDLNTMWTEILNDLRESEDEGEKLAGKIIAEILGWDIFEDIIDPEEGFAPNGLIKFFQKIIEWFRNIIDWFKNLFN